jgi:hypothetical protein
MLVLLRTLGDAFTRDVEPIWLEMSLRMTAVPCCHKRGNAFLRHAQRLSESFPVLEIRLQCRDRRFEAACLVHHDLEVMRPRSQASAGIVIKIKTHSLINHSP